MRTPTDNTEQRRARRKRAECIMEVIDVIACRPAGHLGDLSAGGLMLISGRAPRDKAIYQFRVRWTGPDARPRSIEVGVQALWHKRATRYGQAWAGYRIIAISDDDAALLNEWLG